MSDTPIHVTQPFLPPLEEFVECLETIWESHVLTNGGPFHRRLETEMCEYLGVPYISLFANGTIALMTALQALEIEGDVITTPYSFVATAHSLLWRGLTPVFADINPSTLNISAECIEAAVTPSTTAILAVHCYGHPCDVDAIQRIADKHDLRLIYDAAHAFGVRCHCGSVLNHGDLSVLSFHATKVFNTCEGGAIVCRDIDMKCRIDRLKNFGIVDELTVTEAGINGKLNEVSAALGVLQLRHFESVLARRRNVDAFYRAELQNVSGITCVGEIGEQTSNYAYFPILVGRDYPHSRDGLYQKLRENGIFARRYFYPLISEFPMYRALPSAQPSNLPVAARVAEQVLCLPIHPALEKEEQQRVVQVVRGY